GAEEGQEQEQGADRAAGEEELVAPAEASGGEPGTEHRCQRQQRDREGHCSSSRPKASAAQANAGIASRQISTWEARPIGMPMTSVASDHHHTSWRTAKRITNAAPA